MTGRLPAAVVRRVVQAVGLVGCVLVVFGAVEVLAWASGAPPPAWSWLVGALVLAVAVPTLQPLLERVADRAAYGRNGDPYAVLTTFVQRISDTLAVDDVLPHLARTAVQATHSSSGGVRLWLADGEERHETWPPGADQVNPGELSLVLEHAGEEIGRLEVVGADDELRNADRELLSRLAGPAGLAVSNVRLTLDLRRTLAETIALAEQIRQSRQRLLDTARDQRERFAQAVHRRVLTRLEVVDQQLSEPLEGVSAALRLAMEETRDCLEALRDLASGVFPPALRERGVSLALDLYLDQHRLPVVVRTAVADDVRFPAAVESAAYFCCVALADDLAPGERLAIDLAGDPTELLFLARGSARPSSQVEQLVRDRVEALGGELVVGPAGRVVDGYAIHVRGRIPVSAASPAWERR